MKEDSELLQCYAETGSEEAFAEIVRRHLDLTYSVAMRQLGGDPHLAQDVSQKVFTRLARKAKALSPRTVISGWLYQATQFCAIDTVRAEQRRRAREQEAQLMHELSSEPASLTDWDKLRPVIDRAIAELPERDRDAVTLRFFENRTFAQIGDRLQLSEDAARMRVDRSLEKVRRQLSRRGLTSTTAALALAMAHQVGLAAPAGLAVTVTGAALSGAAAATTLGASVLNFMITHKTLASAAALVALFAAGTAIGNVRRPSSPAPESDLEAQTAASAPAGARRKVFQIASATSKRPPRAVPPEILIAAATDLPREDGAALVLNLTPFYRQPFATLTGEHARYASFLGRQVVDGVPLQIDGAILFYGLTQADRGRGAGRYCPRAIQGVRVGRAFDELHLVHHASWPDFEGRQIAAITLHYQDGSRAELPLVFGGHLRDGMRLTSEESETLTDAGSKIIWRGPGPGGAELHGSYRLYKTTLNNPEPGKIVETLDVSSAGEPLASYNLIAATVTQRDPARAVTPPLAHEPDRHFDGSLVVHVIEAGSRRPVAGALVGVGIKIEGVYVIAPPLLTSEKGEAIIRYPGATTSAFSMNAKKDGIGSGGAESLPGRGDVTVELAPDL